MEAEITQKLRGKGVDARCPQERRMIRRSGKWQEQLYTLFPSYIFVSTPDVYRVYYAVRDEDGVLHLSLIHICGNLPESKIHCAGVGCLQWLHPVSYTPLSPSAATSARSQCPPARGFFVLV